MNSYLTFSIMGLIVFCIIAEAAREVCFKFGANDDTVLKNILKPVIWLGIFFWIVELVAWLNVLEKVPLSIAFPIASLVYITVLIAGKIFFKEHISKRHILGAFLITIGVACVGMTGI